MLAFMKRFPKLVTFFVWLCATFLTFAAGVGATVAVGKLNNSGLLGICGFLLGSGPDRMFEALAGLGLHLGTMDHVVHILLGVVFLAGGFLTRADLGDRG